MILKKINLLFLGVSLFVVSALKSQEFLPELYDSTLANHQLIVHGGFLQHGTSLSNEFSRKFIFGGEISDDLSRKAYERQKSYNRVGAGARIRVAYKSPSQIFESKPNWSWMVEASNEIHGAVDYSDALFGLAFLGNASFLGESVNFSSSSAQYLQYFTLGGGIHNRKNKNFITLNAVLPQNFFSIASNRGSVSFSEDGTNVDLVLQGEFLEAASHPYFKGIGAALNFDFNIPFGTSESFNGVMKVTARNIGVYQLQKVKMQEVDTEIAYSGFQIEDFSNANEMTTLKDTLGVTETTGSTTKLLPGFIQVGKVVTAHSKTKIQSIFGVRMYTNYIYKPMVYAGAHYQANQSFSLGSQLAFGGYGNLRFGLYVNYATKNLMIGLGSEDILGVLLKSQHGHSGLIKLAWKF